MKKNVSDAHSKKEVRTFVRDLKEGRLEAAKDRLSIILSQKLSARQESIQRETR